MKRSLPRWWAGRRHVRSDEREGAPARRPSWLRYDVAALAVGATLSAKLLDPWITEQSPFLLLASAVAIGSWFGGLGPGLLATVLGALGADYFFLRPVEFSGPSLESLPLLLFCMQGLLIASLFEAPLRLEVRDWGRGFAAGGPKGETDPGERVGLSSMHERVALLGGRLEVQSEPGVGTVVVVAEVPLAEEGPAEKGGDGG